MAGVLLGSRMEATQQIDISQTSFDPTDAVVHSYTPRPRFALPSTQPPIPKYPFLGPTAMNRYRGTRTPFQQEDLPLVTSSYIRFAVSDLHGKSICKIVPARHRLHPIHVNCSFLGTMTNSSFAPFVVPNNAHHMRQPAHANYGNIEMLPDFSTERLAPWLTSTPDRSCHPASRDMTVSQVLCEVRRNKIRNGILLFRPALTPLLSQQTSFIPFFLFCPPPPP